MTDDWSIGSFDPSAWAGIVLTNGAGHGFALRFVVEKDGQRADRYDLFHLARAAGPHAPDGSYARVSFDTSLPFGRGGDTPRRPLVEGEEGLVLEWSAGRDGAVARLGCDYDGFLEVVGYFPWDWQGECSSDRVRTIGARCGDGSAITVAARGAEAAPEDIQDAPGEARLRFRVCRGTGLYVAAAVAAQADECDPASVDATLERAGNAYADRRATVSGEWNGLAASLTNNIHWMVSLQPETGRRYTPAGRKWIFPAPAGGDQHWTVFCWDAFFNALELAVESPDLARSTIEAVLATQYDNGNIPNWRGRFNGTPDRSQPPVGSFAVLKCFLRTGDRSLLEMALPFLERWSGWWRTPHRGRLRRDGNGNGLFNWGCDVDLLDPWPPSWEKNAGHHQRAAWESGQDDLPNWDEAEWVAAAGTLDLDAVDLNSLIALDYECLAIICETLGLSREGAAYRERYRGLVERINESLWHEAAGMYLDRRWDGRFSPRLAATNFLPLLAGIPDTTRAARMLETLTDDAKFWGEFVIPTISRDDPAFPEQQYWRGTIWPPTNYLVYQGLRRYGFDRIAGEVARRGVDLFLGSWRETGLCRENYDSRTGEGGGQWFQSWGPLFALAGIEEFIDVTPWDGLRIGRPDGIASSLDNVAVAGHMWRIRGEDAGLEVWMDGAPLLRTDVPAVLRHVAVTDGSFSATCTVVAPTVVRIGNNAPISLAPGAHPLRDQPI